MVTKTTYRLQGRCSTPGKLQKSFWDFRELTIVGLTPGFGTVRSTSGSSAEAEAIIDFGEELGVKHFVLRYAP